MKKQKTQPTKKTKLIAPSSKITPPPPPSYLNKNSYPKHLSLLKQFTLILFTTILLGGCDSSSDPKTITAAYPSIEANVYTSIAEVTPTPSDTSWRGTWAAANLPDGLKIAADTGAISGTPTAMSDKTDYTITLTGTGDSEGVDGSAAVSITIMSYTPLSLTAAQVKITDGTKSDGTKKFPSHAMVFDIATTDTVKTTVPVEFLLVKKGLSAPATLEEFRRTATITMTSPVKDSELVMAFKSALLPSEKTSLYLAHDSQGNYPLDEGTEYTLYAAQPESSDTTPKTLGDFTTGTHLAAASYTGTGFAEDISTMETTGNLYMAKTQFIILHFLKEEDLPDAWTVAGPPSGNTIVINGSKVFSNADFSFFARILTPKPGSLSVGIVPENDFFSSLTEVSLHLTSGFDFAGSLLFKLID